MKPRVLAEWTKSRFAEVLLKNREKVERVTYWGIAEQYSWRADWPLFFDLNDKPKPAYEALRLR